MYNPVPKTGSTTMAAKMLALARRNGFRSDKMGDGPKNYSRHLTPRKQV